jgi:D-beta-D-heptose 7-phosphate kinase/D-beta-D-heptose 1-phosphate adenosyltransferase
MNPNNNEIQDKLKILEQNTIINNICVLGDIILDKYQHVVPIKMSPEAPVLIVRHEHFSFAPGGAGNVAMNCGAMGNSTYLVGIIGKDSNGQSLLNILNNTNVHTSFVINSPDWDTIEKRRIVDIRKQHILRVDYEKENTAVFDIEKMRYNLRYLIDICDTLVISDYNKGMWEVAEYAIDLFKSHNKFVLVNAKPQNIKHYFNADLIIMNEEEYKEAINHWCKTIPCEFIITCGANGMWYHTSTDKCVHIPAVPTEVVDVCGAGDTVTATIAVYGRVDENILHKAAENASIVISKHGTVTP